MPARVPPVPVPATTMSSFPPHCARISLAVPEGEEGRGGQGRAGEGREGREGEGRGGKKGIRGRHL